jgi:peroxiredoxin
MKRPLVLATILACATAIGVLLLSNPSNAAPDSTFVLLDGQQQSTAQLKGQVTLINFWATSCVTCVAEMPQLVTTYNKFHPLGYNTIAVAIQSDPPSYVVNFAQSRQLPFSVAIDNTGAIAQAWGNIELTPTSFLVDKNGHIVKRYVGQPNFTELHQLIDELLRAPT